ncbi:ribosomal-protein-alanine acetyltransferase [Acinetobacter nectaris CIP 110549]|uniref:[Ribosomal protein bS18]-alanine N-acetyltransferase n=1 Tax=Acinetobacter nectaris CIP 110549 TaxID=1392540 RepID=V2TSM8_9GAMM|nr:ribosomal protein S18-alanine N-acetyltransferase [Acinetobacter nectaris]ESK40667.1 ribosomal-protein-alanine acetyltransferase [Acinetobacter nectaris CIP 110549]
MIRFMEQGDVTQVYEIEKRVQSHPWSLKQFTEAQKNYHTTVYIENHEVCGFCILQPVLDEANLLLMAVHPKYQGKGIGFKLLEESLDLLKNDPIQIFLEVRESNLAAIKLYEKAGFHQIDLRKNYYPKTDGSREHAIIMIKSCNDDFSSYMK